jgi:hypothetical protein
MKTTMKTTAFKDKSARRFITPSLTLSAAALGVSAAHGAVVVSDFADVTVTGLYQEIYVRFDPTNGGIFAGAGSMANENAVQFSANAFFNTGKYSEWTGAYAFYASSSIKISLSSRLGGSAVDSSTAFDNIVSLPSNLTDAYFGVRSLAGSNPHYGWVKLSTGADIGGNGPVSVTIHSAAIETTANTAITIPSAVPEPSSVLLLGLAAGAGAFRRRRQAA